MIRRWRVRDACGTVCTAQDCPPAAPVRHPSRFPRLLAALCALPVVLTAQAQVKDGESFDNWTVRCEDSKDAQARQCFIFQNLVTREGAQRVLHVAIGYLPDRPEPIALVTLPLGISLPPGASIQVDDGEPTRFPVERCEPNGCRAGLRLESPLLDAMKTGQELRVTFQDGSRKPVTVPLSLQGFTAGLRALK